ncbi:MAG: hypothetical protein JO175_06725 [Candidatus Eremiobacteraeota bacterium]|nr:hypothetical protein [Candidatus Eremiobacteraeota bacterium]
MAEIADSGQRYGGHTYRDCLDTARSEGVPVVYPRAGDEWRTGDGVTLHFIGPSLPFITNSHNDINENSIAFTLRYKSFCMLFTGDAGAAAEERYLPEGVDLRCDVGRLFGHPAPSTIATFKRRGVQLCRTDEDGAATLLTTGESVFRSGGLTYAL